MEVYKDCLICKGKNLGNNMVRMFTTNVSICWKCEAEVAKRYNKKIKLSPSYPHLEVKQLKMSYLELWINKYEQILAGMVEIN